MRTATLAQRPAMAAALLAGGTLVALVLLWGEGSPLSRLVRLDLGFLFLPVALLGVLLALARLTLWLQGTGVAGRVVWRLRTRRATDRVLRLDEVLPVASRALTDLGWAALGLGVLASASELPGVIAGHPWTPDVASLGPYLGGLDSLAPWGIVLLAPFIAARAVTDIRPEIAALVGFPWRHLAAFVAAYAVLGDNGALSTAFALDGAVALLAFALAVGLSYAALVIRRLMAVRPPERLPGLHRALYAAEAAWIVVLWGAMALLALAAGNVSTASVDASYAAVLRSLSLVQTLAVLLPFALIHFAGVLRPAVASILGTPVGHLALLAALYAVFSGSGVVSTAFEVDVSGMFATLILASALSYAAMVLRNVASIEVPERYAMPAANASRALSALALAAALALVVGTGLAHLPVANAVLLDRPGTRELGESLLPFLGGFHAARYSIAWLVFTATAMLLLPRVLEGHALPRYRAVLWAVSYFAVGCLTWLTATGLSAFGHGFTFGGAIAAAGMFSLALTRLAQYAAASSNPGVADVAGWLVASQVRCFVFGGALAFYVLLLRPVIYEMLWFAALYEYVALLVLLLAVLMAVVNRLRLVANTSGTAEPAWTDWSHHQQVLESKPDPRAELADALRQRFVDRGDWRPLWVYLFGLLYRGGASLDAMLAVCRFLRRGAAAPPVWYFLDRNGRRSKRLTALEHALDTAGRALAAPVPQIGPVSEDDVRKAAASFIDWGTDPVPLAVALTVAHCQRGNDPEETVDRWFSLLDAPDPLLERLVRPWGRSNARVGAALRRFNLVDSAIASLFEDATQTYKEVGYADGDDAR